MNECVERREPGRAEWLAQWWHAGLIAAGVCLLATAFMPGVELAGNTGWGAMALVALLALGAEYIDSSLGMGYGTTLTPLLLMLGYTPLQIVPAVLVSECLSGLVAGVLHHRAGNVDFGRGTTARRAALVLGACSVGGTVAAVYLALRLPPFWVTLYIGLMVFAIGVYVLRARRSGDRPDGGRIVGLGVLAAFNKGLSGGGYGPLLTGGQVIAGVPEPEAVAVTSLAEGVVCAVGAALYFGFRGLPPMVPLLPLTVGALLSVPAAAWTVRRLPSANLRSGIGYATLFLGGLTLARLAV